MCGVGGLYEGGLTRGVTQVLKKRWAYLPGSYTRGAYRQRNTAPYLVNLGSKSQPFKSARHPTIDPSIRHSTSRQT